MTERNQRMTDKMEIRNNENPLLKENERIDDLQIKGYKIIQNPEKFCFGMDAVLLSDFARTKPADQVLDMGTGTGIIPILMEAKEKGKQFKALEIQEESADMARRSVLLNHLEDRISIVTGDIKEAGHIFGPATFQVVTCNPPYMIESHGIQNTMGPKTIARHEVLCNLEDVIREASRVLKSGGHFFMVHRPFRLPEIMQTMMKYKLEPKRMQLVYPYIDKEPNMVLIEGVKGGNARMTVEKPIIVYDRNGDYTGQIYEIYGDCKKG